MILKRASWIGGIVGLGLAISVAGCSEQQDAANDAMESAAGSVEAGMHHMGKAVDETVDQVASVAGEVADGAGAMADDAVDTAKKAADDAGDAIGDASDSMADAADEAADQANSAAADLGKGFTH